MIKRILVVPGITYIMKNYRGTTDDKNAKYMQLKVVIFSPKEKKRLRKSYFLVLLEIRVHLFTILS